MSKIAEVSKLRAQRSKLCAQLADIDDAPTCRAEVVARLDAELARHEANGLARLQFVIGRAAHGRDLAELFAVRPHGDGSADLGPVLLALLGRGAVLARLRPALDALDDGPTTAERLKQGAALRTEVRRLEVEEERAIDAAELLGEEIPRRADADPAIVLGLR